MRRSLLLALLCHLTEQQDAHKAASGALDTLDTLDPSGLDPSGLDPSEAQAQEGGPLISKATVITKAWGVAGGGAVIEGWVSTEDEDAQRDIVPPESFASSLAGYAARRMPLSSEHALKAYPIGHGQRIALVRDGQVFAEATHPSDQADFEHFPGVGTGVYGRYLVTEAAAATAVAKGNIGGFSWVGRVPRFDRRPGGRGRIFRQVDPWMESTIAAYPINSRAIVTSAKES